MAYDAVRVFLAGGIVYSTHRQGERERAAEAANELTASSFTSTHVRLLVVRDRFTAPSHFSRDSISPAH